MSFDGTVRKIDPSNGNEIWKFEDYKKGHSTITVGLDGYIYVASYNTIKKMDDELHLKGYRISK